MITALEIFSNPKDLAFTANEKGFGIFRGPGHNGKLLVDCEYDFKTRKSSAEEVGKTLKIIIEVSRKELKNKDSIIAGFLNPGGEGKIDESAVLTEKMVDDIVAKMTKKGEAYTYKN